MKSLPGRLTIRHIEMAKERGDNYIFYKGVNYSLKQLRELAGIKEPKNGNRVSRTKPEPETRANIHSSGTDNSDGTGAEPGGDSRKE